MLSVQELDSDNWDIDLKQKQRLFVLYYCTDFECWLNGTRSYKKAYRKINRATGEYEEPGDNTAAVQAHKILRNAKVKRAIKALLRLTQADIDEENIYRILHLYGILATFNPADIVKTDGTLTVENLADLGELAVCVKQITRHKSKDGSFYSSVVLQDRDKALAALAHYLNLVRSDDVQQAVNNIVLLPDVKSAQEFNSAVSAAFELPSGTETGETHNE